MKSKNRNIDNNLKFFIKNFKFKSLNLSFSKQLILLGSAIGIISLFMPWIIDNDNNLSWNSFNSISGNIGFLLILLLIITIFTSLSTSYKEKLKLYTDLSVKNHFIIITSGIFILSFSIIAVNFVNGLQIFFENIINGKGIILSMVSGIIILIGGFITRKEYYENNSEIILNNFYKDKEQNKKEDNMKLPF